MFISAASILFLLKIIIGLHKEKEVMCLKNFVQACGFIQ